MPVHGTSEGKCWHFSSVLTLNTLSEKVEKYTFACWLNLPGVFFLHPALSDEEAWTKAAIFCFAKRSFGAERNGIDALFRKQFEAAGSKH